MRKMFKSVRVFDKFPRAAPKLSSPSLESSKLQIKILIRHGFFFIQKYNINFFAIPIKIEK